MGYNELPDNIKAIVNTFDDDADRYEECDRIIFELELIGWTADYGLDGILFDFHEQ